MTTLDKIKMDGEAIIAKLKSLQPLSGDEMDILKI